MSRACGSSPAFPACSIPKIRSAPARPERRHLRDTGFAPLVIDYYRLAPAPIPPPG